MPIQGDVFVEQQLQSFTATLRREDLEVLAEMVSAGKIKSIIDRRFSLAEVPDAVAYSESGRARGKLIITID